MSRTQLSRKARAPEQQPDKGPPLLLMAIVAATLSIVLSFNWEDVLSQFGGAHNVRNDARAQSSVVTTNNEVCVRALVWKTTSQSRIYLLTLPIIYDL